MKILQKIDNSIWNSFSCSIWDPVYFLVSNSVEEFMLCSIRNSFYWNLELTENSIKYSTLDSIKNSIYKLND